MKDTSFADNAVLKKFIDASPHALMLFEAELEQHNNDFRVLLINNKAKQFFEISEGASVTNFLAELTNISGSFLTCRSLRQILQSGTPQQYEVFRDGQTPRWFELSVSCLDQYLLFTATDITRHKQKEESFKKQTTILQGMLNNIPISVNVFRAVKDENGELVDLMFEYLSTQMLQKTGLREDEMIGKRLLSYFPHTPLSRYWSAYKKVLATKEPEAFEEYYHYDGLNTHVYSKVCLLDDDCFLVTYQDINELVEAKQTVFWQANHHQEVLDNVPFGIALINPVFDKEGIFVDGYIKLINRFGAKMANQTVDCLTGILISDFFPNWQNLQVFDAIKTVCSTKQRVRFQEKIDSYQISGWFDFFIVPKEEGILISLLDVTSLKETEETLVKQNELLESVFNSPLMGLIIFKAVEEPDGRPVDFCYHRVNNTFLQFSRIPLEKLLGKGVLEMNHLSASDVLFQRLVSVHQDGIEQRCEHYFDQLGVWHEMTVSRIQEGVVVNYYDITARRSLEEKIKHQAASRLQLATTAAQLGVWELDLITGSLYWDERMYEIHGTTPDEINGDFNSVGKIIHPDDTFDFILLGEEFFRTGKYHKTIRIILPKTGELRYVETQGIVLKGQEGNPERLVGVCRDVTESRLAQESLRESEARFREMAELVDDIFYIRAGNSPDFLYINHAYERLTGLSREELYANPFAFVDRIIEQDRPQALKELSDVVNNPPPSVFRMLDANGSVRWLSRRSFLVKDESGVIIRRVGVASDITPEKEREAVLRQALEHEKELSRQKSMFVATASHEFRTPLATILSSLELLQIYLRPFEDTLPSSVSRHIKLMETNIQHLTSLLNDVLTLGRLEASKVAYTPSLCHLPRLIEQLLINYFHNRPDSRKVQLHVTGTPKLVMTDPKLMDIITLNLVSNAFKFSSDDVEVLLTFREECCQLKVRDRGIGIPPEDMPHLFERFYRASNSGTVQGTGLGLSIVRQLVEIMNGTLSVESEVGSGSCFIITLPITPLPS